MRQPANLPRIHGRFRRSCPDGFGAFLERTASSNRNLRGGVRELAAKLRTHIIRNGIAMGGASQKINEDGKWIGAEVMRPAFKSVVDELYRWTDTLTAARRENAYPA